MSLGELVHNPHPTNRRKKLYPGARKPKGEAFTPEQKARTHTQLKAYILMQRVRLRAIPRESKQRGAERRQLQEFLDYLRSLE